MFVKYHYPAQEITEVVKINNPANVELFRNKFTVGFFNTEAEANA